MNELYHSDTYLGEDYSDGIKHWKYVKKEKVNGNWRYYYSDAEYEKAQQKHDVAKMNLHSAQFGKAAALYNAETNAKLKNDKEAAKYIREYSKYSKETVELGKKYLEAKKSLKKTKLKTFARRTIAKGVAAVGNFFSGMLGTKSTSKTYTGTIKFSSGKYGKKK